MPLCPHNENCPKFPAKYDKNHNLIKRSCYYEAGCWKGDADSLIFLIRQEMKRFFRDRKH